MSGASVGAVADHIKRAVYLDRIKPWIATQHHKKATILELS